MKKLSLTLAIMFCFTGFSLFAADNKDAPKADKPADSQTKEVKKEKNESKLAGRWEGKITRQDGEEMKMTYIFKIDGEKLSGTMESPMGEREISNGKTKGDEISFTLELGDNSIEYQGKLSDDKIKMKSKGPFGEREMTLSRAVDINGQWSTKFEAPGGDAMEITFIFKVDGEKLTGKTVSPMGELDIINGKVKGNEFTFDVDLNGNSIGHICKISGDEIKLKLKDAPAEMANLEMILKRVAKKDK
jgi:hypothetical protein